MTVIADDCVYLASFGPELDGTTYRGHEQVRRGAEALINIYPDIRYGSLLWRDIASGLCVQELVPR